MDKITGIYRITNKQNGKMYIGQSVNILDRWRKHRSSPFNPKEKSYNSSICKAIRKYGVDNFAFEIIEKCNREELNEKEIYWIAYFDTYNNGYNDTLGGQGSPKEKDEKVLGIINDLKETTLYHREIAEKWNVCRGTVDQINTGSMWKTDDETYPLRARTATKKEKKRERKCKKTYRKTKKKKYCIDCGREINKNATRCIDCYKKAKNTFLKMNKNNQKPTKDELFELILNYPISQIAKQYNVSGNAVRKWCKGYQLPYTHSELKRIREEKGIEVSSNIASKKVIQMKNGNVISVFSGIRCAARNLIKNGVANSESVAASSISDCCLGKSKTAYGYIWKFADN